MLGLPIPERGLQSLPELGRVETARFGNQHEVDQVLYAGARQSSAPVGTGIGVNLFSHMLGERNRRHLDWINVGEGEQSASSEHLWLGDECVPESDVYGDVVEQATSELARGVIAHGDTLPHLVEPIRPFNRKGEVVAEVDSLCGEEVRGRGFLVVLPTEIDVLCGSRSVAESVVEGKRSLENPSARRHHDQPGQQPIEDYPLAEPGERDASLFRTSL